MPKPDKKRRPDTSSDSDSGPDDRGPAPKRVSSVPSGGTRPGGSGGGGAKPARKSGNPSVEGQEPTWDLGKMKLVKVREWRGKTFIDIREWYVDKNTMDTKPGKKGISLTPEQYQLLKSFMPEIDQSLP